MKIFWESSNWAGSTIEPTITCLAWIPNASKENKGLLAVGSESGVVGITYTDISGENQCNKRYNFNLRGHHSAIHHVSWNKPQTKLVSCDVTGFIYVWIKNEERWSVELVNDRGVKVKDFCWSPSGNSTLICYEDNFVLIGSSSGTRVWSNNYDTVVHCGCWNPLSEEVVMGFNSGSIQVLNEHGNIIHEREIFPVSVMKVAFSPIRECDQKWTLGLCSALDVVVFANTYYEIEPFTYQSVDPIHKMEWSNDGTMLAIICASNRITIISYQGDIMHTFTAPISKIPLTAFTWAHDDNTVIIAAGGSIAVGRVIRDVPLLSQLVTYQLWVNSGRNANKVDQLTLPTREKNSLKELDHHVIQCRVPKVSEIPKAICKPTEWRWYCTIVPVPRKSYHYMLCVEHMGGLVPILLGRQINRIIPQFLISLPPHLFRKENGLRAKYENGSSAQVEDLATFRRESNQRASLWRQSKRQFRRFMNKRVTARSSRQPPTLVHVTSNVWCTKFKISNSGIEHLPNFLANVVYKTSVLHLQPRQMTIHLSDLRDPSQEIESKRLSETPIHASQPSLRSGLNSRRFNSAETDNSNNNNSRQTGIEQDVAELQKLLNDNTDIFNGNEERNQTPMEFEDDHDTALLAEEKIFYSTVLAEFDGLKEALNTHIERMKQFATEIEFASCHLAVNKQQQPSIISRSLHTITKPIQSNRPPVPANTPVLGHVPRPSTSTGIPRNDEAVWRNRLENIEYIDDDGDDIVVTDNQRLLLTTSKSSGQRIKDDLSSKKKQKQLNDIRAVVEKLSLMANELSTRMPASTSRNPSANLRVGNNAVGSKATPTLKQELPSTIAELRAEVRNIAQHVSQIEEKITIDMLNDIRGDLQQRVFNIKAALGEPLLTSVNGNDMGGQNSNVKKVKQPQKTLTMTNKTPFWNETTQVYQLDFGGRVTQESAKNFQIEYNSEQVMQFGRIENGSYTLDFKSPFSCIQAFSIALASITQRLK
jgi:hypothetical protein